MCAVRSADGRCTTAPPTLPRRTEISPSVSRMWIASRSAGGLTPNSAEQALLRRQHVAFLEPSGQDVVAQPGRDDLGDARLTNALARSRVRGHRSWTRARRLPNWKPVSLSGGDATVSTSPMHSTSSSSSSRAVDVTLASDSRPRDVEAEFGEDRRRPTEGHGQRSGLAGPPGGAALVLGDAVEEHGEEAAVHQSRRPFDRRAGR